MQVGHGRTCAFMDGSRLRRYGCAPKLSSIVHHVMMGFEVGMPAVPLNSCVTLVSYITSLNLRFFIGKMGIRTVILQGCVKKLYLFLGDVPG